MVKKSKRRQSIKMSKSKKKSLGQRSKNMRLGGNIVGWDSKLGVSQNFKKLGIIMYPNETLKTPQESNPGLLTEYLTNLEAQPPKQRNPIKSMDIQEQYMLQDLIEAHGDDYKAMQRSKLNKYCMTAAKLCKRIEVYNNILAMEEKPVLKEAVDNADLHPIEIRQKNNNIILPKTNYVKEVHIKPCSQVNLSRTYKIREPKLVKVSYSQLNSKLGHNRKRKEGIFRK